MTVILDHTIVPSKNKEASAEFFARIFGLSYEGNWGHFAPVRVNESLGLDFDTRERFEPHHYAFYVSEQEFDEIFERLKDEHIKYGSGPYATDDMKTGTRDGGPFVYFRDLDGHVLEVMTRPQVLDPSDDPWAARRSAQAVQ